MDSFIDSIDVNEMRIRNPRKIPEILRGAPRTAQKNICFVVIITVPVLLRKSDLGSNPTMLNVKSLVGDTIPKRDNEKANSTLETLGTNGDVPLPQDHSLCNRHVA